MTSLPGYDGELPSKHYSGYLPVGKTSGVPGYIHYWYIESESDPTNDPLVYWTNGGPGGSGINAGLLTEMGQMHVNDASFPEDGDNSTGLKVFYNPTHGARWPTPSTSRKAWASRPAPTPWPSRLRERRPDGGAGRLRLLRRF